MTTQFNFYIVQTEDGNGNAFFCRVFRAPLGCGFTCADAQVWTRYGEWKSDTAEYRETHKHFRTYARAHAAMIDLARPVPSADLIGLLRDVAALLPVAGRMHPADLHSLQSRVIALRDKVTA